MAASSPYFMFHPADYLADTQHLTTEEHGAYLLLLMNYWQTGKALNNASDRLAVVVRLSSERWQSVQTTIAEFFDVDVENDLWTHGRMEHDLMMVRAKSIQASYAGRLGGLAPKKTKTAPEADAKQTLSESEAMNEYMNEQMNKKELVQISFERFWDVYPRKQGKAKAKSAFEKAIKAIEIEALIEAVTRYAKDPNRQDQFTKMPETYLNGQCWNDAALPQRALTKSGGFAVPSGPTPTPPRFTASEVTQGIEMPENIRQIALGRSN